MRRYLLKDGAVVNTIELEDGAVWTPPAGLTLAPKRFRPPAPDEPIEDAPEPEMDVTLIQTIAALSDAEKVAVVNVLKAARILPDG